MILRKVIKLYEVIFLQICKVFETEIVENLSKMLKVAFIGFQHCRKVPVCP